jgi:tetratricopeptide (TPR) repeat protein
MINQGQQQQALALIEELKAIAQHLDDAQIWGYATTMESTYHEAESDLRRALQVNLESLPVLQGDPNLPLHLGNIAWSALDVGRYDIAGQVIDQLEDRSIARNDRIFLANAKGYRGVLAFCRGDLTTGHQRLVEAVGELRRLNLVQFQVYPLHSLAQVALAAGNATEAEDWARHLIDSAQRTLLSRYVAAGHTLIARASIRRGPFEAARGAASEALDIVADTDDTLALVWVLATVGQIAWATGNPTDAAVLHAGAETLRTPTGFVHPAPRARELEHEYHQIRDALGTDAFNTSWKTGTSLSKEELVSEARWVLSAGRSDGQSGG